MPDLKAHFFGNQLRHGKRPGQQNNADGDPILSTGYFVASEIYQIISLGQIFTHNNRISIKSGTGANEREWRGRFVVGASLQNGTFPNIEAVIFVVAPFMDSPGFASDSTGGDGTGDPGDVTIVVTNPQGQTAPATASPTQVPID